MQDKKEIFLAYTKRRKKTLEDAKYIQPISKLKKNISHTIPVCIHATFFYLEVFIFIYKESLEKTEGHKNGQYRETGNIGYIRMDNTEKLATFDT